MPPDVPIPPLPAATAVALVGKQPVPWFLDLNGDGIPDYQQKRFRDALAGGLFWFLGKVFPGSPWAMALRQLEPAITTIIEAGSK
jgi:hypothetical protein